MQVGQGGGKGRGCQKREQNERERRCRKKEEAISSGMITLLCRGGLRSSPPLCLHFQSFSTSRILAQAGPLDALDPNVVEVKREGNPSEVYHQLVTAGRLTADPHQQKVVAQVHIQFNDCTC